MARKICIFGWLLVVFWAHAVRGDEPQPNASGQSGPAALRLAPGVEVARIDGNNWSIGIRGFGSDLARSVLVLIDGRTVYTPLFAGTNWDVQNTNMSEHFRPTRHPLTPQAMHDWAGA